MPSHLPLAAESCRAKVEKSQVKSKEKAKKFGGKTNRFKTKKCLYDTINSFRECTYTIKQQKNRGICSICIANLFLDLNWFQSQGQNDDRE